MLDEILLQLSVSSLAGGRPVEIQMMKLLLDGEGEVGLLEAYELSLPCAP